MKNEMKKTYSYDEPFKLKHLGEGEWVSEPDFVEFTYKKYQCKVCRIVLRDGPASVVAFFGGHLCGYVRIPADHPYHHKIYEDMAIDCYGSLTFGEVSDGHWIGFDCAHCGDLVPSMKKWQEGNELLKKFDEAFPIPEQFKDHCILHPTYKNIDFCIAECKSIVNQLIKIAKEAPSDKN